MPRNASGVYLLPASSVNPPVSGTTIVSADFQNEQLDIAAEITNSLDRLGRAPMLANLSMGGFGVVGLTSGTIPTTGQASENFTYFVDVGTPSPVATGVPSTMATLNLSAGRWLVAANCLTAPGAGVATQFFAFGVNSFGATFSPGYAGAYAQQTLVTGADKVSCLNVTSGQIVASTSAFTLYFVAQVNFSGGAATMSVWGNGGAIRLL